MTDAPATDARPEPGPGPGPDARADRPGSAAEHALQERLGTVARADRFYADQVRDRLLPSMVEFVERMTMVFVSTSGEGGECDAAVRGGPPGFVAVLDDGRLALPDDGRRTGAASRVNVRANPHVGLLMVDFVRDRIGLHVNGRATLVDDADLRAAHPDLPTGRAPGVPTLTWLVVEVEEAYIHCRKHIPRLAPASPAPPASPADGTIGGAGRTGTAVPASGAPATDRPREDRGRAPSAPVRPPRRRQVAGTGRTRRPEGGVRRG